MNIKRIVEGVLLLVAMAVVPVSFAAPNPLLTVQTGYPDITFQSGVNQGCTYDGTTFTVSAVPNTLQSNANDLPAFFSNGLVTITADIDGNGTFSGGAITINGSVGSYTNPVLTGTITDYGIADFGATDRIEFVFTTTGGSLATDFGVNGGIIVSMEGSTYEGAFVPGVSCTQAKGNIGPTPEPPMGNGTGTIGYWKNHPEAWPIGSVTLGGVTYTKNEAIAILKAAVKGDKTISMAKQLIAAKLNVADGNDASCIADTIDAADEWLSNHGGVGAAQRQWDNGDLLHDELDAYNNGLLCAPHRD